MFTCTPAPGMTGSNTSTTPSAALIGGGPLAHSASADAATLANAALAGLAASIPSIRRAYSPSGTATGTCHKRPQHV